MNAPNTAGLTLEQREKFEQRLQQIDMILEKIDFWIDGNGEIQPLKTGLLSGWRSRPYKLRIAELQAEVSDIRLQLFGRLSWWKLDTIRLNDALSKINEPSSVTFDKCREQRGWAPGQIKFQIFLDPETYALSKREDYDNEMASFGSQYLQITGEFYPTGLPKNESSQLPTKLVTELKFHCGDIQGLEHGLAISCPETANFQFFKNSEKIFPQGWAQICSLYKEPEAK